MQVQAHPDPLALVQEYAERDSTGEFTAPSPWLEGAVRCPGHVPGYDVLTVISSYRIEQLQRGTDTARVTVWYDRLGEVSTDTLGYQVFELARRAEADTFVVVRTPFGWRIESPPNHWQLSVRQVLERFRFRPEDRLKLEQSVGITPAAVSTGRRWTMNWRFTLPACRLSSRSRPNGCSDKREQTARAEPA